MSVFEIDTLKQVERVLGWRGRYFHTASMTFAHYEFEHGARIHEHRHHAEEVYQVLEGELEIVIDDVAHIVGPGRVAVVPANARHHVKALTSGKVIVVDHPVRHEFG
jgi:quercetin dioxygenase-like cupin family protein